MTYLSWASLYEGPNDEAYYEILIPRIMENIIMLKGIRHSTIPAASTIRLRRASIEKVAEEACKAREAFHLVFIHSDTGGRGLESSLDERSISYCDAMNSICEWPRVRCITITPRHETEAWVLADPIAVTAALGYVGSPASIGLPSNADQAERLVDPKATLAAAVKQVRGRRRPLDAKQIIPAIAQRQNLSELRRATSFRAFETNLLAALADVGCV